MAKTCISSTRVVVFVSYIKETAELLGIRAHMLAALMSTKRYPIKLIKVGPPGEVPRARLVGIIESRTR